MTTVDAIASSPDKACKVLHNGFNRHNKPCEYYAGSQVVKGTCQDKRHRVFKLTCVPNALKGSVDNASAASATLAATSIRASGRVGFCRRFWGPPPVQHRLLRRVHPLPVTQQTDRVEGLQLGTGCEQVGHSLLPLLRLVQNFIMFLGFNWVKRKDGYVQFKGGGAWYLTLTGHGINFLCLLLGLVGLDSEDDRIILDMIHHSFQ
ncbi:hypothetical protein C8R41DRAFT_868747 [Lentinula lateritia]|uniref:SUEL-type lectin domain-containing protein n=1 Tax=Lentinula lateritia TaxID=40482 RepID=A0ABQ8V9X7_9AGAR|nr:hypothetical protein C8R41DRAFT_868747 [Lentinula lateritia]